MRANDVADRSLASDIRHVSIRPIAFHEAGHAVVARVLGLDVLYTCVTASPDAIGRAMIITHRRDIRIDQYATYVLAGHVAQGFACPVLFLDGAPRCDVHDLHEVRMAISGELTILPNDDRVTRAIQRYQLRAARIVKGHWRWICATARQLERWGRLTGIEIERLRP